MFVIDLVQPVHVQGYWLGGVDAVLLKTYFLLPLRLKIKIN